ncbi:hypothetical protein VSS74_29490 [Conexibacter stalactiti]|uniref:Uncharacterized protein n=1 Tax=Conexibacter stalactiti TaxID=1940611 RepID=A0ABU4HYY2_9ACTN|nr:hypothetical protein [Conexibacter stalactiti]MDW5598531.1 hypothetical protein [Conexibacter stalactiti]MEC5039173.1 hypothetical protein [Conexibacter stalactiti]
MTTTFTTTALRRLGVALACAVALLCAAAASAQAEFGLVPDSFVATVDRADGRLEQQAGGIPYSATTRFEFRSTAADRPDGNVKEIDVELPPGFIGNPQALPRCSGADFANMDEATMSPGCPAETQVGIAVNTIDLGFRLPLDSGVFNLVPPPGAPAAFGFTVLGVPVTIVARVRDEDHGLTMSLRGISGSVGIYDSELTFWGVPADSRHDAQRGRCLMNGGRCAAKAPLKPFLANPVDCQSGPLRTTLRVRSWQDPSVEHVATADTESSPHNCGRVSFRPAIDVDPETTRAGAPSGYDVTIAVPQGDDPRGSGTADPYDDVVTSQLRDAVVTLPLGTAISPSAADGLAACTPAQIALDSPGAPTCPEASKLGEVEIVNPLMDEPLRGPIYLAKPTDEQLVAIYLVASGSGVTLKLPGTIDPDPVTGQLTARFLDNPQLPFSKLSLRFKGGPRAPLANPSTCGPATTTSTLTPWSAGIGDDDVEGTPPATPSSSFTVDGDGLGGPCPASRPFAPAFAAGVADPTAGASSPFTLNLARADGDERLAQLSRVTLPPGLLANVGSVPLCGAADAAAGSCPVTSRVGTATVASGAGTSPFQLAGGISLTEGYRGAPYGLSIAVPAVAGPFDLGTVVVRAAIHVNNDASLTVDADPLPTILKGIPLDLRSISLRFSRAGFMVNPTNCSPLAIGSIVQPVAGAAIALNSPFRVGDCASLPFKPGIEVTATAAAASSAALRVRVTQTPEQAHARSIAVTLPTSLTARLETLRSPCTLEQATAGSCPARTRIGTATAITPVLATPLSGPVYMIRGGNRLPDLLVQLRGAVAIDLRGTVVITRKQQIRSTFGQIPDVALTSFDLRLDGGPNSALSRTSRFCSIDPATPTVALGQNGKRFSRDVVMRAEGCKLGAHAAAGAAAADGRPRTVVVRATAPGPGTLRLSGRHLRAARRTVAHGGTFTVKLPLTAAGRRALAGRGRLSTTAKVVFTPQAGGAASTVTARATLKASRRAKK